MPVLKTHVRKLQSASLYLIKIKHFIAPARVDILVINVWTTIKTVRHTVLPIPFVGQIIVVCMEILLILSVFASKEVLDHVAIYKITHVNQIHAG
jgi:hypothetical protein